MLFNSDSVRRIAYRPEHLYISLSASLGGDGHSLSHHTPRFFLAHPMAEDRLAVLIIEYSRVYRDNSSRLLMVF